jgi:hypothetical protein
MSQPWKEKSRHPQKETYPLVAIHASLQYNMQESHCRRRAGPPIVQSFFPCTANGPPISSTPQTQSTPRRHGRNRNPIPSSPSSAQDHHWPASHRKAGPPNYVILPILRVSPAWTFRCSSTFHSKRQPRPDLAMLEYEIEDTSLSAQI